MKDLNLVELLFDLSAEERLITRIYSSRILDENFSTLCLLLRIGLHQKGLYNMRSRTLRVE